MDEFITRWNFVRSETLEILSSLSDKDLLFQPDGNNWQPLYYQFGCMARTQLIYAEAASLGRMDFTLFSSEQFPSKAANQTVQSIITLLDSSNKRWIEAISENSTGVSWPDGNKSVSLHIENLAEHERLHHGQLISYFTLAALDLPVNFKRNWAL